jgi:hypothetical protein
MLNEILKYGNSKYVTYFSININSNSNSNTMRKPWFKVIFSIAIIIASIPTVITDIREGFSGTYTHYGTLLIGISYFIESLFWVLEMWISDVNKLIDDGLDGYDGFEEDIGKWLKDPGNKDAWDKEWERTNKDK